MLKLAALLLIALPCAAQLNIQGTNIQIGGQGSSSGVQSINGSGGSFTFTGPLVSCTTSSCVFTGDGRYLQLSGGTMTGALNLFGPPTTANMAATKGYVDSAISANVVQSINGTFGAFTFTGAGVTCLGTTCTFSGGGGSGTLTSFQGRTTPAAVLMISDVTGLGTLSNNTTGNAATVTTINSQIVAGTNVTISGSGTLGSPYSISSTGTGGGGATGPAYSGQFNVGGTSTGTSLFTTDSGGVGILNQASAANSTVSTTDGDGQWNALNRTVTDNLITRNVGNITGIAASAWHVMAGDKSEIAMKSAGIGDGRDLVFDKYSMAGDGTFFRGYINRSSGGRVDTSGEGFTGLYMAETVLQNWHGTTTTGTAGATSLAVSQTNGGCGGQNTTVPDCSGGGGILLRTNAMLFTTTVSAFTEPSMASYGTMTVAATGTVSPTAIITAGIPDIPAGTNYATGNTITATISSPSGTIPASGDVCLTGGSEVGAEEMPYTLSGTTLTLSSHRFPHSGPVNVFFNKCTYIELPVYTQYQVGGRAVMAMLGYTAPNTIAYTGSDGGNRSAVIGGNAFRGGVTGQDVINVWDGAFVLGGTGSGTAGNMPLAANLVPWTSGDTLEEAMQPAVLHELFELGCSGGLPATNASLICDDIYVKDSFISPVRRVFLQNLNENTTAGGGYLDPILDINNLSTANFGLGSQGTGAYNTYDHLQVMPLQRALWISGCAAIDTTSNCTGGSPAFSLWLIDHSGNGGQSMDFVPASGVVRYNQTGPVFEHQLFSVGGFYTAFNDGGSTGQPGASGNINFCGGGTAGILCFGNGTPNDTTATIKAGPIFSGGAATANQACTQANGLCNPAIVATITTTANINDTVTVTGITSSSHCSAPNPRNSAALAGTLAGVTAYATNAITLTHAATAGMIYDLVCTAY
jgi:hypothetical protein